MTTFSDSKSSKSALAFLSVFCLVQMLIIVILAWKTIVLTHESQQLSTTLKNLETLQDQSNDLGGNADWGDVLQASESTPATSSAVQFKLPTQ